jgi:hypothetical protein
MHLQVGAATAQSKPKLSPAENRQLIDQFYLSMIQIGQHGCEGNLRMGSTETGGRSPNP